MATPRVSVVILSYNRRGAVLRTLRELVGQGYRQGALGTPAWLGDITLVDNASTDGTVGAVRMECAWMLDAGLLRVLELPRNVAIAGFNRGAEAAPGEYVLILDDDAWPDWASMEEALALLEREPGLGGVALLPVHPQTGQAEWRFSDGQGLRGDFPVFGCANLLRAKAWHAVDGYEETFFLYRNDVDLALKLLGAGWGVAHSNAWFAWHDSPHAACKSERWLWMATRNWVWLARRHARTWWQALGAIALHVPWTLRAAGLDGERLSRVVDGLVEGLATRPPALPAGVRKTDALWRLVRMQLASKARGGAGGAGAKSLQTERESQEIRP